MKKFITPYQSIGRLDSSVPSVFLAGPVQGAPDWQSEAAEEIFRVAAPRDNLHVLSPRLLPGITFDDEKQQPWERDGLEHCRDLGGIAFWFAAQSDDAPLLLPQGRGYAPTSRQELGKVTGWLNDPRHNFPVVVGFDPNYSGGANYMRKELEPFNVPIVSSITDLALIMVDLLNKKNQL